MYIQISIQDSLWLTQTLLIFKRYHLLTPISSQETHLSYILLVQNQQRNQREKRHPAHPQKNPNHPVPPS